MVFFCCLLFFTQEVFADSVRDYSYELSNGVRISHETGTPARYVKTIKKQNVNSPKRGALMVSLIVPEQFFPSSSAVVHVRDLNGAEVANPKGAGEMVLLSPGSYVLDFELSLMDASGSVRFRTDVIDIQDQFITTIDVSVNEVFVAIVDQWVNLKGFSRYQIDVANTPVSSVDVYWTGNHNRKMDIAENYGPLSGRIAAGTHDFCLTVAADRICVENVLMKPDYQYLISIVIPSVLP